MSTNQVPVDATDPRLEYHGAWRSDPTDLLRAEYHNGTFRACSSDGDYVALEWEGGDVTIVGTTRSDHGYYSVIYDNSLKQYYNGNAPETHSKAILWASPGLQPGKHRVELRNENQYMRTDANTDKLFLDLDYMSYIPMPPIDPAPNPPASSTTLPPPTSRPPPSSTVPSLIPDTSSASSVSSAILSSSSSTSSTAVASQSSASQSVSGPSTLSLSVNGSITATPAAPKETFGFAIQAVITTGVPKVEPLPVERSQGSVSALVARFQTAAAHNAATAQREASRRSSSSSTTSGNGEERPRVISAGGWRKAGEGSGIGGTAGKGAKGAGESVAGQVEEKEEVLKDVEGAQAGDEGSRKKEMEETVQSKEVGPASSMSNKKSDPNGTTKTGPSSPKTSKAPARIATTPSKAPTQRSPRSPTTTKTIPPQARTRVSSNTSLVPSPRTATGKTGTNGEKAAPKVGEQVSQSAPKNNQQGNSQVGASTTAASSSGSASKIPRSRSSLSPNTPKTTATVSKSSAPKSTSQPVSKIAATKDVSEKSSEPSSASTSTPVTAKRPPSSFNPSKPLTPSMTGPSPSRRPISSIGQSPLPTPLRPQVTGTPSKPTASSLAKARNTPLPNSPSTSTLSLDRASSKRMSMGPIPSRQTRAGTESPLKPQETGEGLKQKTRISGSSSMSRLLQGTAASRAKAVEGLPGSSAGGSPGQAKKAVAKGGVSKSTSAKSLTGAPKSPTATKTAGSVPKKEEAVGSQKTAVLSTSDSKPAQERQSQPPEQPEMSEGRPGTQQSVPVPNQEHMSSPTRTTPNDTKAGSSEATGDITATLPGLTEPVGDSPIGRIGLPAVHVPNAVPTAPGDMGQNPVIAATPSDTAEDTRQEGDKRDADTGDAVSQKGEGEPKEREVEETVGSHGSERSG